MTSGDNVMLPGAVAMPPYSYGRECAPSEKVWQEDAVRRYGDARVAAEQQAALQAEDLLREVVDAMTIIFAEHPRDQEKHDAYARACEFLINRDEPSVDPSHGSSAAVVDIAAERQRLVSEGWTAQHDDAQQDRGLAQAARCYVGHYVGRAWTCEDGALQTYQNEAVPFEWPDAWDASVWKPRDPRRDLVRAGALIVAEIERLDRATAARQVDGGPR